LVADADADGKEQREGGVMFGMMMSGCIAIAAGNLCFSANGDGAKIYCSDFPMTGTFTCKEYNAVIEAETEAAKRSGCISADGSTSTCAFQMPNPPR
jgi:hypothetical protein